MDLASFKNISTDRLNVEELIVASAFGRTLKAEFEIHGVDVPEYVDGTLKALKREIKGKISDKLDAERRRLMAQLETLKTPTQKKADLTKQLQQIEKRLAAD